MQKTLRLSPDDDVAVALLPLQVGEEGATERVPRGHKIATRDLAPGEVVRKYSQPIGYALEGIRTGSHVHTHNLGFRQVSQSYEFAAEPGPESHSAAARKTEKTFLGFRRENGSVGTRNYVAVISSVNCSATAARMIASHFDDRVMASFPNVDGVAAFVHGTGCGMADSGEGFEALQRVMWGYARNPNVCGVLMVGLGCEINQIDWLVEAYGLKPGPLFRTMNIQERAGLTRTVELGISHVMEMLPRANECIRVECPASELMVALQCGGSDSWSGVTANPALGNAVDKLVELGGTGVLAETPEIYGAEHLLTRRAANRKVGESLIGLIRWWEDYAERNRGSINNNPSPGNKTGGLTTILEKSLGAVSKGGTSSLEAVYKYGEQVRSRGFVFMDSPGYDPASVTGQIASGCNLVAFTTGRGSAFGSKPSPCIKIATNTQMFERLEADMDINAGTILDGTESVGDVGDRILEQLLSVASGEKSKSEAQGLGDYEFVPWQIGAVM